MSQVTIRTDDLMTVQDAARLLGRPRIAVYRMIQRNAITGIVLGGVMFIPTAEIPKMKEESERTKINDPAKSE